MSSDSDPLLRAAVQLFDRGEYLAAHEVLDELWAATTGPEADFYKGLIQASIALHHLEQGNPTGARKLEKGTRRLLAGYLPSHLGVDLTLFLEQLQRTVRGATGSRPRLGTD